MRYDDLAEDGIPLKTWSKISISKDYSDSQYGNIRVYWKIRVVDTSIMIA